MRLGGPQSRSIDDVEKRKFLILPGLELQPICNPVRRQSLHRLHYSGSLTRIPIVTFWTVQQPFTHRFLDGFMIMNGDRIRASGFGNMWLWRNLRYFSPEFVWRQWSHETSDLVSDKLPEIHTSTSLSRFVLSSAVTLCQQRNVSLDVRKGTHFHSVQTVSAEISVTEITILIFKYIGRHWLPF
jgi:hypothetical protein